MMISDGNGIQADSMAISSITPMLSGRRDDADDPGPDEFKNVSNHVLKWETFPELFVPVANVAERYRGPEPMATIKSYRCRSSSQGWRPSRKSPRDPGTTKRYRRRRDSKPAATIKRRQARQSLSPALQHWESDPS